MTLSQSRHKSSQQGLSEPHALCSEIRNELRHEVMRFQHERAQSFESLEPFRSSFPAHVDDDGGRYNRHQQTNARNTPTKSVSLGSLSAM